MFSIFKRESAIFVALVTRFHYDVFFPKKKEISRQKSGKKKKRERKNVPLAREKYLSFCRRRGARISEKHLLDNAAFRKRGR